jgi:UPF0755 protein
MTTPVKKKSSAGLIIAVIILFVGAYFAFKLFGPNIGQPVQGEYVYVHTGADYEQVKAALQQGGFVGDIFSFDLFAKPMGLPTHIHAGKYKIGRHMSNYRIIRLLRSGKQTQVKLVINKLRTKKDLAKLLSMNLEPDSAKFSELLNDPAYTSQFGFDTATVIAAILPDTYELLWNTTADKAFRKIEKSYAKYWDDTRKAQAKEQNVTPMQATIIASIVDEETNLESDKPNIASVYLNRLRKGMKLQADPTVKFAVGDFTIRRVAGPMLENTSPYNTYLYAGLPPGPICTPSRSSLVAVLTAPKTNYLYFCAKEDFSGHSNFAATYDEQLRNAAKYRKALDARGIH